ncbi:PAS domain S-box protein [Neptunicoccus sediminis]|uniref:PAS domain S-box protein n=1 Tax=Neptunicoccus sediminis TaxID=1892596 RepID=UPI0008461549|nr:PAS domain S-box protein [Neptunicoccus sediminis]
MAKNQFAITVRSFGGLCFRKSMVCAAIFLSLVPNVLAAQPVAGPESSLLAQFIAEYYWYVISGSMLFMSLLLALVAVTIRNIHLLRHRRHKIIAQGAELEFQKQAMDHHAIVSIANNEGIITYVNENFKKVTGYTEEEIIGKEVKVLWAERKLDETMKDLLRALDRKEPWSGEIPTRKKNGNFFWAQATMVPFFDSNGNYVNTTSIRTDVTANKMAEAKRQLTSSLDLLKDEVAMFWPDTLQLVYMNKAAREQNGWSELDYRAKTVFDVYIPIKRAPFEKLLESLKHTRTGQASFEMPAGKRVIEITLQYVTPPNENPRYVAIIRDVTEAARSKREVANMRTVLDLAEYEVYIMDSQSLEYTYLNKAALRAVGWNENEYRGRSPADDDEQFDRDSFEKRVAPLREGKKTAITFERRTLHRRPTEVTIQKLRMDDQGERFVAIVRDITERATAEREIRRFKTALDLSSDSVHMFWPETLRYFYGNEEALRRADKTFDDFINHGPLDTNTTLTRKVLQKRLDQLMSGEVSSQVYETQHVLANGSIMPVEVNLQYIEPRYHRPYFLAIIRDLTKTKAADKAKSEFVATVSHELRTPLTSIKGSLGLVRTGAMGVLPDKPKAMIEIAYNNCERLVRLINDILDIEKIEAGKMDFQMERLDMTQLLQDALEANKSYGEELDITFTATAPEVPVYTHGDAGRLLQVMANLMSNAAKFSNSGSTVDIKLEAVESRLRVTVSDQGAGIPLEAQPTIFDKFTQADSSDVRKKGGTGLGLSISKMIVEQHGGELKFRSVPDVGTDFWFELELLEAVKLLPASTLSPALPQILVCEDDRDLALTLKNLLEFEGFNVTISPDVSTARERLNHMDFDAMTLDLTLPDGNGLDLLQDLRNTDEHADLPVVIITGSQIEMREPLPDNLKGLFRKPPNSHELITLLQTVTTETTTLRPRILHVEDDAGTREVVKNIMADAADVDAAPTLDSARGKLDAKSYDLMLLDLNLPDGNGLELLKTLKHDSCSKMPIIVFSGDESTDLKDENISSVMLKSRVTNEKILAEIMDTMKNKLTLS